MNERIVRANLCSPEDNLHLLPLREKKALTSRLPERVPVLLDGTCFILMSV